MSNSQSGRSPISGWLHLVVGLGALLTAAGAVIALVRPGMLVSPNDEITSAVRIYAGYLASRNIVLATMMVALLTLRLRIALSNLMVLIAFIQVVDACIDCAEGRWAIVPGILLFAVMFFIGASRLSGYPFWKREAWERSQ